MLAYESHSNDSYLYCIIKRVVLLNIFPAQRSHFNRLLWVGISNIGVMLS